MSLDDKSKISRFLSGIYEIPENPSDLTKHDEEAIAAAIPALREFSDYITEYNRELQVVSSTKMKTMKRNLEARMDRYWDANTLDWMMYLFYHYHPLDGSRYEVISYVVCVLVHYIISAKGFRIELVNPAFLALAFQLWEETDFDYLRSAHYSSVHGWWDPFLTLMFEVKGTEKKVPKEKIAPAVDLILVRLRARSRDFAGTGNVEYVFLVNALSKFLSLYNPTGARLNRIIRCAADFLRWVVDFLFPKFEDAQNSCLHMCFMLLHTIAEKLKKSNSMEPLCEALQHGYLGSIAKFGRSWTYDSKDFPLASMTRSEVSYLLSNHIPKFIYFHSLLKAMKIDMESDHSWREADDTNVAEAWRRLREKYRFNVSLKQESDRAPCISLCDNPMHETSKAPNMLLYRCSGCDSTWYCSSECQKAHWDKIHRKECNKLRLLNASSTHTYAKLGRRDCTIILRQSLIRVIDGWNDIQAMAKRKYPRKKMSQLSVVLNYTAYPPEMDVTTRDRAAIKAALAVGSHAITVQCVVPMGQRVATITAAGDILKMESTAWFAGRSLITYSHL